MRILFLCHRFGKEHLGGAERHLWNLAEHMARRGHEISVATTLQTEIRPFLRFGLNWSEPHRVPIQDVFVEGARPIRIIRFPVRNLWKPFAAILQKFLQHRWEKEELAMEVESLLPPPSLSDCPLLLSGWHLPEATEDGYARWTMGTATLRLPSTQSASLHIRGKAFRRVRVSLERLGESREIFHGKGDFEASVPLSDAETSIARLHVTPTWRPWRDARTLGIAVTSLSITNRGQMVSAPLHVDHRSLRGQDKKNFMQAYVDRAERRPRIYSWIFDQLRGPRCPGMKQFLEENHGKYDWVIAGILPFSVITTAAQARRRFNFRLALLPLFHIDDDFYYWRHYLDAMRKADASLANSEFSANLFYPFIGSKAVTAGAGVNDTLFLKADINGDRFRRKFGFDSDQNLVLSVGRKAGPKRYGMLIDAVDAIQEVAPCRLILVGPDEDRLPITSPNCSYLGALSENDLLDAYDACNVFALMSESESFGMVFVEAWMRRKPVIGNQTCGPVSSLIEDGRNGLLASDARELGEKLAFLLSNRDQADKFGAAGFEDVIANHTWTAIARRVSDHLEANS